MGNPVPSLSTVHSDVREYAIANEAIVKLGTPGQVCVNDGNSSSNVILDATGYISSAGSAQLPQLASPQRLVDTRASGGPIAAGSSRCFPAGGQAGIPANAAAFIVNVTAVGYTNLGWFTLFPNGQTPPGSSTVNFDASEYAIANQTITKLGTGVNGCSGLCECGQQQFTCHPGRHRLRDALMGGTASMRTPRSQPVANHQANHPQSKQYRLAHVATYAGGTR
jgi:hypothetical protein